MRGRVDGQEQEPHHVSGEHGGKSESRTTRIEFVERNCFEETCWMDERRIDREDRQLDDGSTETLTGSRSEEEKTPRGDREIIHNERHQDVERRFGWSGWLSVVVKVRTRLLQAIFELKRFVEWKDFESAKCCDRQCVFESAELERGWSCGRLNGHFPVADFDAHRVGRFFIARMFQEAGWTECWCTRGHLRQANWWADCDAQQSSSIRDGADKQKLLGGASRWTAVERGGQLTIMSAHLPHKSKDIWGFRAGFDGNPELHEWGDQDSI